MRYSTFFPKARKQEFKEDLSTNAILLTKGGFIDQLMAGSYTLLPLGFRVVENIKNIIREELNAEGAQELLMPILHPREIWDQTGRWSDPEVQKIMYQFKDVHRREYGLSFTHEEIVMNLLSKFVKSYKDLPVAVYHFSTKFRNEPRAKSGILRTREFFMKDLYSAHATEADMADYYNKIKDAYIRVFKRIGFPEVKVVEAAGGVFTDKKSHEFQIVSDVGEDEILFCDRKDKCECKFAQNKEIYKGLPDNKCPGCSDGCLIKSARAIEVGNIFPLGTKYSEAQKVFYTDEGGEQKPIWFASYGIGPTRVIGALVEVFHDERGIIWPKSVAPFQVYLISLDGKSINTEAQKVYETLNENNIEVLWDDRDTSAGEKFANADLLGFPYRLVVSEKSGDKIELKKREEGKEELLEASQVISKINEG